MKLAISVNRSPGIPYDIIADTPSGTVGFFKVVAEPDRAVIYYMYINRTYRHRGIGKIILESLQKQFDCISTQIAASTSESISFLKKHNFKQEGNELVWREKTPKSKLWTPSSDLKNETLISPQNSLPQGH